MSALIAWIRNIDIRKMAAVLSVLAALAHAVAVGQISLVHAVPALWIDPITAWCNIYVYVFPLLIGAHGFSAIKWPSPAEAAAAT